MFGRTETSGFTKPLKNMTNFGKGKTLKVKLAVPEFYNSTLPIRYNSKILRHELPAVCMEFCRGTQAATASKRTQLSDKTIRELYSALRALLFNPRYRKWHSFDIQPVYQIEEQKRRKMRYGRALPNAISTTSVFAIFATKSESTVSAPNAQRLPIQDCPQR